MRKRIFSHEEIAELELRARGASAGAWQAVAERGERYYGNFWRLEAEGKLVALLPDYGPEDKANLALVMGAPGLLTTLQAAMEVVGRVAELAEENFFADFSDPSHPRCFCGGEGDFHESDCLVGMAKRLTSTPLRTSRP
ncbi:MAG: hypothetical protein Kow00122_19850 [Thermoleophilia bacterium]